MPTTGHALMTEEIDVAPGPRAELGDEAGVATDNQQLGELVDHGAQHVGAPVVQREDQIFADDAVVAVDEDTDAAEIADLAERAANRLGSVTMTGRVSTRATFMTGLPRVVPSLRPSVSVPAIVRIGIAAQARRLRHLQPAADGVERHHGKGWPPCRAIAPRPAARASGRR